MEDCFGLGPEISAIGTALKITAILGLLRSGCAWIASGASDLIAFTLKGPCFPAANRPTARMTASPIRRMEHLV